MRPLDANAGDLMLGLPENETKAVSTATKRRLSACDAAWP
jgi:hypothetical protein